MGGTVGYEYLGETAPGSGLYNYKIIFKAYTNCDASSQILFPEPSIYVGIYHETTDPNGYKQLAINLTILLTEANQITPNLPLGCTIGSATCIYEGVYIDTVTLSSTNNLGQPSLGYHLMYNRCCRNASIVNIFDPGINSMGFYAFIPPFSVVNNSPVFNEKPLPFICTGDSLSILNSATDAEGDSLVFSFETPYLGYASISNTLPFPPDSLLWPIPIITWQTGGFSTANPFGPHGFSQIDSYTGISEYIITAQGNYVVAVEIKEYRNGSLIAVSRRDMQLLALACPTNPFPVLSATTPTVSYTLEEGDSLCFNALFTDSNADGNTADDSLNIAFYGNIFDTNIVSPTATSIAIAGVSPVEATFCWKTSCLQGNTSPYLFNIVSTDNGCPHKSTPVNYSILINKASAPTHITGPTQVCQNQSNIYYEVDTIEGASYLWSVTGGQILGDSTQKGVFINWISSDSGIIYCYALSKFGCASDTISLTIHIGGNINVDAGNNATICPGDSIRIGGNPSLSIPGISFQWTVNQIPFDTVHLNPYVKPLQSATYYIEVIDTNQCFAQDSIVVNVSTHAFQKSNDTTICQGDTIPLWISGGSNYVWSPNAYISTVNGPSVSVHPLTSLYYVISLIDGNQCSSKDSILVSIFSPIQIQNGDTAWLCFGDTLTLTTNGGINPIWSPNVSISDIHAVDPKVFPSDTLIYTLQISDINNCSYTNHILVTPSTNIPIDAGNDTTICMGDTILIGGMPTAPLNVQINWVNNGAIIGSLNQFNPLLTTNQQIEVIANGTLLTCSGSDTAIIFIHPQPNVSAGLDITACQQSLVQFNAETANTYDWDFGNGSTADIQSPSTTYNTIGNYSVILRYTDNHTCPGIDTLQVDIVLFSTLVASNDTFTCAGDTLQLFAIGSGSFQWSPITNISHSTIANPFVYPIISTDYIVRPIDSTSCFNIDTVKITILPSPSLTLLPIQYICTNQPETLQVSGATSYYWNPGTYLSDSLSDHPLIIADSSINYEVTGLFSNGCTDTKNMQININPNPTANFDYTIVLGCEQLKMATQNTSINTKKNLWYNNNVLYSWHEDTLFYLPYQQNSSIKLVVQSDLGCTDSITKSLNIASIDSLFTWGNINVFTPNGDGINDYFEPKNIGNANSCSSIYIYNRWGSLIFSSEGYNMSWDGRSFDGENAITGTYYYILKLSNNEFKGTIHLLRW